MVASRKRKLETSAKPAANKQSNKPTNQVKQAEPELVEDDSDVEQLLDQSIDEETEQHEDGNDDSDEDIEFTEESASSSALQSIESDLDCPIRIFVGTYTGSLYGLESLASVRELIGENDEEQSEESDEQEANQSTNNQSLLTLFVTDAHRGSIRSVAVSKNHAWLVSSGLDEIIQLFDLNHLRQSGSLHRHSADVNQVVFPTPCTFLSSCADGTIGVWSGAHRWECTGTLKGHKGSIDAMSVHPSGKVLLTSGSDETTRMFDLLAGRLLTTRHRRKEQKSIIEGGSGRIAELSCIDWCDSATHYAQAVDRQVTVFDTEGQTVSDSKVLKSRALCIRFLSLDCLVIGCEDGSLVVMDANKGTIKQIIKEHKVRVRCCERLRVPSESGSNDVVLLVTASTDGQIFVWNFTSLCAQDSAADESIKPIARAKSEARITCVSVALQYQPRHHVPLTAAAVAKAPVVIKHAPVAAPSKDEKKASKKQRTDDIKVAKADGDEKKGFFPKDRKHVKAKPAPAPAKGKSGSKKPAGKGGVKVSVHKKRANK